MKVLIFDTETTGTTDPEVIEAAWLQVKGSPAIHLYETYCERFNPSKPIELGAMATHHIIPSDLTDCRPCAEFLLPDADYLIGHNVDFDWKVAGSPDVKRICTLAFSRWLFPELDSHKQTAMLYHLFDHETARAVCLEAHNALADVRMCHMLLDALIEEMERRDIPCETWEELWQFSEIARIPTVMTFGKHKGTAIKDVPSSYKHWLLGQSDVDPYLRQALEA